MRMGIDASNIRSGGGLTALIEWLRVLNPKEHDISRIIVWGGSKTLTQLPDKPWLELSHQPLLDKSLLHRTYWQKIMLTELARKYCDVLYAPGAAYSGSFRPLVISMQNLLPFDTTEMRRYGVSWTYLRLFILHYTQAKSFSKANGIIFVSEYSRKVLLSQIKIKAEQVVIPHGIDDRFRHEPRLQLPLSDYSFSKPFRFLYVSIIDVYKHQWNVVEAVAKLRQEGIPVALDLVGPAYLPALRRLHKSIDKFDPNHEFVVYHGSVLYSELPKYYHIVNGFLFASTCETFGQILTEAMAAGLPIACSNRSAMPEILGNFGAYFDPEQPDEIAQALRNLLEDPDLRTRCASGAYEKAKTYSWERCANETFSFLNQVAKEFRHI